MRRPKQLTAVITDLVALFERTQLKWTTTSGFASAFHEAVIARQIDANFRAAVSDSNPQTQREASMAQSMAWAAAAFATPEPSSLAAVLVQLGVARGLLDMQVPLTGPVAEWFSQSRAVVAGRADKMVLNNAFDAISFIRTVHSSV